MILEGLTEQGAVVPVQVTDQGRLVAEGLQGPQGPQGEGVSLWTKSGSDIYYNLGRVGIGSTAPAELLSVNGNLWLGNGGGSGGSEMLRIWNDGGVERIHASNNPSALAFGIGGSSSTYERMRLDTSGRLLVGTSTARSNVDGVAPTAQVEGTTESTASASIIRNSASGGGPLLFLGKSRNASVGGNTVVNSGDTIGTAAFAGNDGTNFITAATIAAQVDGTPGTNDMPGRLVFSTTKDGESTATAALVIDSQQRVKIKSPNGSWWAITVSDSGALSAVAA